MVGRSAWEQKEPERALHSLTSAAPILEKALGRGEGARVDGLELGEVFNLIGDVNRALGDLTAADEAYRRIGRIYAAHCPPESERHASVLALLGNVAAKQEDHARAADLFEQALAIAERAFGDNDIRLQDLLYSAAEAQRAAEALPRAAVLAERLLEMCKTALEPDPHALVDCLISLST